ncbi:MFS transporter [Bradyrhizobium sp. LHD-71]|uniref:MFS transporter n=1 Tax=Bradyrhizobium sp. LHD-71 TaxID=3072141 RepID=UPI00280EA1AC|nr:MFS transporter [Bradyrhizobium sp. LHD-71]MDQ8727170.1 MFS transporter [Bradyrhizobium sp. LHD-71]
MMVFVALYAAIYGAFGVASPFWPRFFEERGLSPQEIGALLGLGTLVRLISGPIVGRLADAAGELRAALALCMMFAAASATSLLLAGAFWTLLLIHLMQAAALAPITSIADALAIGAARRNSFEYGRIRGTGSAVFVVGTLTAGALLGGADISIIVWMHTALLAVGAATVLWLSRPDVQPVRQIGSPTVLIGGLRELWSIATFRSLMIVAALVYGSHAVHDAFAVIRWHNAGIGPAATSVLWSEAVIAEVIVFFVIGPALIDRLGTNGAAALAAAAGVVRWCVAGTTTSVVALAIVQPLHGLTFALLHLVCMRLIGMVAPPRLAATGQALYAFGAGLATATLMLVSGPFYAAYGGAAFLPMALLCALAVPLAWSGLRSPGSKAVTP